MIVLGLTGSVGMGKSTTARLFAEEGAVIWDADAAVHRLYASGGGAVDPVSALLPDVVRDGAVDRERLRAAVTDDPALLARLEAAVHPLVQADREAFLDTAAQKGIAVAVCDIPLLFETGDPADFDAVIVVSAPAEVQRQRVMARPGMTAPAFQRILSRQMPDAGKRARADYVIDTSLGIEAARQQVRAVLAELAGGRGNA
jgi:dephospho-CoA kinase